MAATTDIETYNYSHFSGGENFLSFRTHLQVGSKAPDAEAVLLDSGKTVKLSQYWQDRDALIEFGSLT
jgi:hypothetical protein